MDALTFIYTAKGMDYSRKAHSNEVFQLIVGLRTNRRERSQVPRKKLLLTLDA